MDTILLPPSAAALMESTRSIGYSIEAAIADVIDNSIAAQANLVEIDYMPEAMGEPYVTIADNGHGMSMEELQIAMQYGSKNPLEKRNESDLGRYGLGLKTASLSQCQILTVISKKDDCISCCRWDLRHIRQTDNWSLLILQEAEIQELPGFDFLQKHKSGTVVIWQELDRIISTGSVYKDTLGLKMVKVREHLSLVFHRYLSGDDTPLKITIKMNNDELIPKDPFLHAKKAMDEEKITVYGNQKVKILPFLLPHISKLSSAEIKELGGKDGLRKNQGFYVYRNQRLVIGGTWFRMMVKGDLSKLARIRVDIPNTLDDLWTLDIKKSTAIPPEEVQQNLKMIINKIADASKRTWTYRGKKEISDNIVHLWKRLKTRNNGIIYEINREHPIINSFTHEVPGIKTKLETLLKYVERSIPLNQLYLDLNNDEKIENDTELEEGQIREMLKQILNSCFSKIERKEMLEKLQYSAPFCVYPEIIQVFMEEENN